MNDADGGPSTVSPEALQDRIDRGEPVRVLDLRDREEFDRWHLAGPSVTVTQKPNNRFIQARVIDSIDDFVADVAGDGPITVVCARGEASGDVAETLAEHGHDAHNLDGGMEGWARLALANELEYGPRTTEGAFIVVQYRRPASGCLSYIVISDGEAVVVDPLRAFVDRYVTDARDRGVAIETVADTHVHADHVSGLRELADTAGADAVMPAAAVERGVEYEVGSIEDGDEIVVGDTALTAVRAPGHTTGMTAFSVDGGDSEGAPGVLLSGDSLFVESVARPDVERGDEGARDLARELYRTVTERFERFPDETVVAPGHHSDGVRPADDGTYTAKLGGLRGLPAFAMTESEFVDYVTGDMPPRPANFERVIAVNLGRESADEDEAFELELGPNNCAATPADD